MLIGLALLGLLILFIALIAKAITTREFFLYLLCLLVAIAVVYVLVGGVRL